MWGDVHAMLRHPYSDGAGPIQLIASQPFYDEEELPFTLGEGGVALHLYPERGFRKQALAGSIEEQWLIIDHPEDEGWLVPDDIVADWMARNVSCPSLDDVLLSHPLYEYLTRPDEKGHSRGGPRGDLVQWAPGIPTLASIYAPEFLPDDDEAPLVNRDRDRYADAVVSLLEHLEGRFALEEVEIGMRWRGRAAREAPDGPAGSEAA